MYFFVYYSKIKQFLTEIRQKYGRTIYVKSFNRKETLDIEKKIEIDGFDLFFMMFFFFFSSYTRFWLSWKPEVLTKSEYHYLEYLRKYEEREFFFDFNPYFGKLLHLPLLHKLDYRFNFTQGNVYERYISIHYNSIRNINSFFGMMTVPLFYITLRLFEMEKFFSFLGAFLCLGEFSLIGKSRYIGDDGLNQFTIITTIFFSSLMKYYKTNTVEHYVVVTLQLVSTGLALSVSSSNIVTYLFTLSWFYSSFSNKTYSLVSISVPLLVFYVVTIEHVLICIENTPKDFLHKILMTPFSGTLNIQTLISAFLESLFIISYSASPKRFNIWHILCSLLLCERPILIYKSDSIINSIFINKYIMLPCLFVNFYQGLKYINYEIYNHVLIQKKLCFASLGALLLNALEVYDDVHISPSTYVIYIILSASLSLKYLDFQGYMYHIYISWIIVIFLSFLDECGIVYGYKDCVFILGSSNHEYLKTLNNTQYSEPHDI